LPKNPLSFDHETKEQSSREASRAATSKLSDAWRRSGASEKTIMTDDSRAASKPPNQPLSERLHMMPEEDEDEDDDEDDAEKGSKP
jgi:hypothetical protein